MMDHYKVLGVHKDASKAEIKEAFRRLALKFHPDKHSQSPTPIQHNASLQFKQLSEAYNVLVDETKRADYNYRTFGGFGGGSTSTTNAGYTYYYNNRPRRTSYAPNGGNWDYDINVVFRVLTRRGFLLNLAFARYSNFANTCFDYLKLLNLLVLANKNMGLGIVKIT
ncbi:hypothetical protein GIB67_017517 [Kingdonia uniflora]|uniref:J domain-containing protein n=1 Tax=Kingdonia uniflora TaxID=39325 RepID=A0A7J7M4U1_9MAGN|nr:hypothetical protein GIB67_017517 [Kingdonia uniflora]